VLEWEKSGVFALKAEMLKSREAQERVKIGAPKLAKLPLLESRGKGGGEPIFTGCALWTCMHSQKFCLKIGFL